MARIRLPTAKVVALAAALAIAGLAFATLLEDDTEQEGREVDEQGRPLTDEEIADDHRELFMAAGRGEHPGYGELVHAFSVAGPDFYGNGALEIDETRRVFDSVMDEIERMADRPRRLRQREWQQVYRAANDAFTALSMHLDAKDRTQAKELEEAHRRLRKGLANLRVRGKKFRIGL
jgi:hypothetical protein